MVTLSFLTVDLPCDTALQAAKKKLGEYPFETRKASFDLLSTL